jgi:hypothetical protein
VLILDMNTRAVEARRWSTNPSLPIDTSSTVALAGIAKSGAPVNALDPKAETHEDYQVMRSAIRLGSLAAFLTGALIVFFTFRVVVEERRRGSRSGHRYDTAQECCSPGGDHGVATAVIGFAIAPFWRSRLRSPA